MTKPNDRYGIAAVTNLQGGYVSFDGPNPFISRRELLQSSAVVVATGLLASPLLTQAATPTLAPEARKFDFLHGRWKVVHRKLKERLAGNKEWFEFPGTLVVAPILAGLGNFDENALSDPKGAYQASSLRLFNPNTRQWSVWWFDSRSPAVEPPVVGAFNGNKGTFYAQDVFKDRPIRVRTTYEPLAADRAQWTQAFSPDDGSTWEVNWIMDFKRARA